MYAIVCQCQHCCSGQKSCEEVKELESGSNLCPVKLTSPNSGAVSQHTWPDSDAGPSCRSGLAHKFDISTIWTAAVCQRSATEFVNQS